MKALHNIYVLSRITSQINLGTECTPNATNRILINGPEGLLLTKSSRIIVTPFQADGASRKLSVVTSTEIISSTSFAIYVRNVGCYGSGPIRLQWTVFSEERGPCESGTLYFRNINIIENVSINARCTEPPATIAFAPASGDGIVYKAFHATCFTDRPGNVIANACVHAAVIGMGHLDAFNTENERGSCSFHAGEFYHDSTPRWETKYRIQTGVTSTFNFTLGHQNVGEISFKEPFKSTPSVFLTAMNAPNETPAFTAIAVSKVTPKSFSIKMKDVRCPGRDIKLTTRYQWVAIGEGE
jgi:hypothetical protein